MPPAPDLPLGRPHSVAEDGYALAIGCILIGLGLVLLKGAGLVTGGIAGVALLAVGAAAAAPAKA